MQIGVTLAFNQHTPPEVVVAAARMVEERGFHSIWVPEHVLFFSDYSSRYPYSEDGRLPGEPDGVLDPFTALTFMAAHTHRVRLGTGICLVPQRHPVYTAKQVADLDYLSGGRFDFGVGVGWLKEEFEALGVPFEARGPRTDEWLGVMQALWQQDVTEHVSDSFRLHGALMNPKPRQQPHPPIYIGGESDAALARVARVGQGWYGFQLSPEALQERLQQLSVALEREGRTRDDISICVGGRGSVDHSMAARYRDLGVDQLIVPVLASDAEGYLRRLDRLQSLVDAAPDGPLPLP